MPTDLILVTRPERDSRDVAERLAAHGLRSVIWALTRIVPTSEPVDIPAGTDALVFTSHNAVSVFAEACQRRDLRAWCVGARTARAARSAGFADTISADGDVTELARLLRDRDAGGHGTVSAQPRPDRRLFYLRAKDVSSDLEALIAGSGNHLESRIIYSAEPGGPPTREVEALLAAGDIGVVALWSRRAAVLFAESIAANRWPTARLSAAVISARVAEPLEGLKLAGIRIADGPDGQAMEATIRAAVRQING